MKRVLLLLAAGLVLSNPVWSEPSKVKVSKKHDRWILTVNGEPFFVKGIGCDKAVGPNGEDYLKMAADAGANSVRSWGINSRDYFDRAEKHGLFVDAGVWFNPARSGNAESYRNAADRKRLKEQTLAHVREMKDHPALLFWNLGNEVFTFTETDEERKAFGQFLEDLIRSVKKIDPNHPVVYAAASPTDLEFLKKYVPSLDIIGANSYGGYPWFLRWTERNNYDRPIVATEYGPFGEWDRMKDANDMPYDPADHNKAKNYEEMWKGILATPNQSLGGYAFVLGRFRNQGSLTWYNINFNEEKREAYWTLYRLYTGKEPENRAPRIRLLKVDKVNALKRGQTISLQVTASDPDGDALSYDYFVTDIASDPLIVTDAKYFPCHPASNKPGFATLTVPTESGMYRVYVAVRDGRGNVAIANRSLSVD